MMKGWQRATDAMALGRVRELSPAFYALSPGGWRDYVTLFHLPYTLWHLSYVVLGAAIAPNVHWDRLAASLAAFLLAMGLGAHALDELSGRPLKTRIPEEALKAIAVLGLCGAIGLGMAGAVLVTPWLLAFICFGAFIAPAYNLEWFGGRFHSDAWFALSWGSFPLVTSYWVNAEEVGPAALAGAAAAFFLSLAQRTLSHRVRTVRRRVSGIEGTVRYADGGIEAIDRGWALGVEERALKLLTASVVGVSVAVLLA
ncbi:MAG: hypothetical protein QME71_07250 [Dehalococcoidia bacterium]|nr:hypothetical protein [Dehalococcoidia bacterium]